MILTALVAPLALLAAPRVTAAMPEPAYGSASGPAQISWFDGAFSNALGKAGREERPIFVYFWAEGSEYCAQLWRDTLSTEAAATTLSRSVCFSADAGHATGARLVQRFGVTTLPTMLFLTPAGEVEDAIFGYIDLPNFQTEFDRIAGGQGTVSALRAACAAAPEDLQLALNLAVKLDQLGMTAETEAIFAQIRAKDPDGATLVGAQVKLWDVQNAITTQAGDPNDPTTFDLAPMYAHVETVQPQAIRFQAWDWIAQTENERGARDKARRAYETAWSTIPPNAVNDWGFGLVDVYWSTRSDLKDSDRAFVLSVARAVVQAAEALVDVPPAERFGMDDKQTEDYLAECLGLLARAQEIAGDPQAAIATLERATQLSPKSGELRARLDGLRGAAG